MFNRSKSGSKAPRFFCESCGAEVPRDAKNCPKCGEYFSSVLCPACGFSGEESLFRGGCPSCGYSDKTRQVPDRSSAGSKTSGFPENNKPAGPLPVWVYILTAAAFTGVLAALLFALSN